MQCLLGVVEENYATRVGAVEEDASGNAMLIGHCGYDAYGEKLRIVVLNTLAWKCNAYW